LRPSGRRQEQGCGKSNPYVFHLKFPF